MNAIIPKVFPWPMFIIGAVELNILGAYIRLPRGNLFKQNDLKDTTLPKRVLGELHESLHDHIP